MTRNVMVALAVVVLTACGGGDGGGARAAAQARTGGSPRSLDVAGVRLGMPAAEARAILERGGWRVETDPGHDWREQVAYERSRSRAGPEVPRSGIASLNATKGDEFVTVTLHPVPSGATVASATYRAPLDGRSYGDVRMQMARRFGAPDFASPAATDIAFATMAWCTGGEHCRDAYGAARPALGVRAQGGTTLVLFLNEGADAERSWRASLAAAVRAASGGGSSF